MFDPEQLPILRKLIEEQALRDRALLDELLAQVRVMSGSVRTIKPRSATSVALVAADGGNNKVAFNPFYLQVVRVVDSMGKELLLDVVSPNSDIAELSRKHLSSGHALTPLGKLMLDLGASSLQELSPMMSGKSRGWVLTYRDLCEWATLYEFIRDGSFVQDTLIVRDGLLRSKIFSGNRFTQLYRLIAEKITETQRVHKRRVWLVGLAKQTEVLDYYRLAISLAKIFDHGSPCFVEVDRSLLDKVYRWPEYTMSPEETGPKGEDPKFNMGRMHFVRFGTRSGDPVWTVDLLDNQVAEAQAIFGNLLTDAIAGFPIPFYPNCLQQADRHSRVADLDMDIVEDGLVRAVREIVGAELAPIVDELRLATDVASRRYE